MGNYLLNLRNHKMVSQVPIIVVLGCTGTGKSKLGIELCKRFNGEIIGADSMQVYKGLDIITNKVTTEEQSEAVHHCIDFVDPLSRYTVVDFQNKTLPLIEKLFKEKRVPIVVGGTNYYIESLLWEVLIKAQNNTGQLLFEADSILKNKSASNEIDSVIDTKNLYKTIITQDSLDSVPSHTLHKCLQEVDPESANVLHFNDRRKVVRSLQVYQQHGIKHSDMLAKQRSLHGGSSLGGPLRYKNTLMLWIQCDKEVLHKRLDDRVDAMLEKGLISELLDFHKHYNEQRINSENPHYTEGIFQSIGFKEFHDYLVLSEDEKNTEIGKKIFEKGIEEMKLATRQYARKQEKWIVNRFLRKPDRQRPQVYGLSATDLSQWDEKVMQSAFEIVDSVIRNETPSQDPLPVQESLNDIAETTYCDVCNRYFVGRKTWEIHIKSKKHQRMKASLKKKSNEASAK